MSRPASAEATALILAVAAQYQMRGSGFAEAVEQAERLLDPFCHRAPAGTVAEVWAVLTAEFGTWPLTITQIP